MPPAGLTSGTHDEKDGRGDALQHLQILPPILVLLVKIHDGRGNVEQEGHRGLHVTAGVHEVLAFR
jgi:hypothetical protein